MPALRLPPAALALLALCALAGSLAVLHPGPSQAAAPAGGTAARPALTVTVAQPQLTQAPVRLSANGNVAAWQEASVGAESHGLRLAAVHVNVGDVVKAGQVLATFAAESVQADLAQARASLQEAQALAAEATANAERARSLQPTGAMSQQQVQQYATADHTAQARVEAARAQLQAQQLRLRNTQVRAPDSGVISARTATVGAVVPSGTELFRMVRQGRLEWRAEVTQAELARIRPGHKVQVTAASGAIAQGAVRMVAPTIDPNTRNGLVYVDLPRMATEPTPGRPKAASTPLGGSDPRAAGSVGANEPTPGRPKAASTPLGGSDPRAAGSVGANEPTPGRPKAASTPLGGSDPRAAGSVGATFLPGMFARGEFALGDTPALLVPQEAVVVRDGFSYVFVLGTGDRVQQRKVQTGRRLGDRIELLEGVDAQARLVVRGAGFLNDGDTVRVVPESPTPGAGTDKTSQAPSPRPSQGLSQGPSQGHFSASKVAQNHTP